MMIRVCFTLIFFTSIFLFQTGDLYARDVWNTDLEAGKKLASKTRKPILLDIYADWCPYCQKMQKNVYPAHGISKLLKEFVLVRINGEKNQSISTKYKVSGFPTIVFLDNDGKLIYTAHGFMDHKSLKAKLNEVIEYTNREKEILKQLKSHPQSVHMNYRAGLLYYQKADIAKAQLYFHKALNSNEQNIRYKKDSQYNLAVVYMDKKEYKNAIRNWNVFLKQYANTDQDIVYARLYRGISYYYISDKQSAKADLGWAVKHLKSEPDINSARHYLDFLEGTSLN